MLILLSLFITVVGSLRDVKVDIPAAVSPGQTVIMTCMYDLEGDYLYSVKWYKGRQEFFRYVPKELPHIKVFPMLGIDVDIGQSGQNKVVLRNVRWDLSGKYRCEVSTDLPYFHTQIVGAHMHVVGTRIMWPYATMHPSLDAYCNQYLKECVPGRNREGIKGKWIIQELQYQKLNINQVMEVTTVTCLSKDPSTLRYYVTRAIEKNCVYALLRQGTSHTPLVIIFKHCDFEKSNEQQNNPQHYSKQADQLIPKTEVKEKKLYILETLALLSEH